MDYSWLKWSLLDERQNLQLRKQPVNNEVLITQFGRGGVYESSTLRHGAGVKENILVSELKNITARD